MNELTYRYKDALSSEEEAILEKGLGDYSRDTNALPPDHEANILCYADKQVIGGITSQITGSRLHVKLLWVHPDHRGRDIGRQLMLAVEEKAIKDNCTVAFVNTLSFQAPEFYYKLGYQEVARIEEFYEGHDRIFYRKDLLS